MNLEMNICLVCLSKEMSGTNIFTGNILEMFLYTTLVQVEKNDGSSEIICDKCLKRLRIAYQFKKDAIESNNKQRSFISQTNKHFQQFTKRDKLQKESVQIESADSYDELDEEMHELIYDHQPDDSHYKNELDEDCLSTDDGKAPIDKNQELVEILGANNGVVEIRETRLSHQLITNAETDEEQLDSVPVYFIEENNEIESNDSDYAIDEYTDELITNDTNEPQYLEYDENIDQMDDATSPKKQDTPQKQSKNSSNFNANNRCDVCNKTFSTRTNLTRHRITHEGRKPYVCDICGNSFTQKGSLNSHKFIHTGERPFKCTECNIGFTQSKSLVFHMRRHTGEKPFKCKYCGVPFRQKDGLKRHISAKHEIDASKYHECLVCGKTLLSKGALNTHVSKHTAKEIAAARKNRLKSERAAAKKATQVVDAIPEDSQDGLGSEYQLYYCEYCDQVFSSQSDLQEHAITHVDGQDDSS